MDSRPPNSTLLVAFVKFDKFDHDFYTFFALILHDLALSAMLNYKIKMCFSDEWRHKIKESHRTAKDFELENLG